MHTVWWRILSDSFKDTEYLQKIVDLLASTAD